MKPDRNNAASLGGSTCRLCGSEELLAVLDMGRMPIAHRMLERADADEERFAFSICACCNCGHTQILHPIAPAVLYAGFNYNFSSWKTEPHFADEIDTVVDVATPERVLDIGANDGRWLAGLRDRGVTTVVGIEPNPVPARIARERGLRIHEAMLDRPTAEAVRARHGSFDVVSARQVIEHVEDLETFMRAAHSLVRDDGWLFVDVPDFAPARDAGDCSVLWEEHISYFTLPTLHALLCRSGFLPESVKRYNFSGGTIAILARRVPKGSALVVPPTAAQDAGAAKRFGEAARVYGERLAIALGRARNAGARTVLYGVGVRACTATNALGLGELFETALDDQPERQGKFMPGSRLAIASSQTFAGAREPIVCVLAVNNENEARVRARFDRIVGAPVTYVSPCSPADIWLDLERLEDIPWN
jgi:2-polyprenyl-3-methyl-5-hydroxy-6-metoxy-1,4-benzoquinol methylase